MLYVETYGAFSTDFITAATVYNVFARIELYFSRMRRNQWIETRVTDCCGDGDASIFLVLLGQKGELFANVEGSEVFSFDVKGVLLLYAFENSRLYFG